MKKNTRRNFIKQTSALVGVAVATPLSIKASETKSSLKNEVKFEIGIATYSLRKQSLEYAMDLTKKLGLNIISIKSMHLPYDSTDDEINRVVQMAQNKEIQIESGGVMYMKTKEEVDKMFEYSKKLGLTTIIGVPNYELLDYVEEKVKEYDIIVAIHNHGPDNLPYENPQIAYDKVKNRDIRMGLCIDVGHVQRIGQSPAEVVLEVKDRIYQLHFWDSSSTKKEGHPVPCGQGVMDIPAFVRALAEIEFKGTVNIEYGTNPDDNIPDISQTVGYLQGAVSML